MKTQAYMIKDTDLQMLRDVRTDLGIKLDPAQIVRWHLQNVIELTNVFVNWYFNTHFCF